MPSEAAIRLWPQLTRDEKSSLIVDVARQLYERDGIAATSIAAVTREAGITRELFYHYFPDKDTLTACVLRRYVEEFVDSVAMWVENLDEGSFTFEDYVTVFRRTLYDNDGNNRPMHRVLVESGWLCRVADEVVDACVTYLKTTSFYQRYAATGRAPADDMMAFVLFGTYCMLLAHPEKADAEIALLAREAYHL